MSFELSENQLIDLDQQRVRKNWQKPRIDLLCSSETLSGLQTGPESSNFSS